MELHSLSTKHKRLRGDRILPERQHGGVQRRGGVGGGRRRRPYQAVFSHRPIAAPSPARPGRPGNPRKLVLRRVGAVAIIRGLPAEH